MFFFLGFCLFVFMCNLTKLCVFLLKILSLNGAKRWPNLRTNKFILDIINLIFVNVTVCVISRANSKTVLTYFMPLHFFGG